VPEVLLSGDHRTIDAWRREMAERMTRERGTEPAGTADDLIPRSGDQSSGSGA
jgi:tRNA G37 N-methylase TrmD